MFENVEFGVDPTVVVCCCAGARTGMKNASFEPCRPRTSRSSHVGQELGSEVVRAMSAKNYLTEATRGESASPRMPRRGYPWSSIKLLITLPLRGSRWNYFNVSLSLSLLRPVTFLCARNLMTADENNLRNGTLATTGYTGFFKKLDCTIFDQWLSSHSGSRARPPLLADALVACASTSLFGIRTEHRLIQKKPSSP